MKRPYSFDQAQADALKGGPAPTLGKVSPEMIKWVTTNMLGMTMKSNEVVANEAIKAALQALLRAQELSEQAGYGSLVLGPLADAQRDVQYAYNIATGKL